MTREAQPFRVDGFRGLRDNYGSLYGTMDIRGISPLFLQGPQRIIYRDYVNNPLAWELFAVKYVFSGSEALSVASDVIDRGVDEDGPVYLHRLNDPRPFALLLYDAAVVDSDEWALELMDDPRFDERKAIVLHQPPTLDLPVDGVTEKVEVVSFAPEEIAIEIDTPANAILSLSMPHYPGWEARLNGKPVDIIRAYGALIALEVPAGQHSLFLEFAPKSYAIGGLVSLLTWLSLLLFALLVVWWR